MQISQLLRHKAVRSPPSTARRPCALRWASWPRRASGDRRLLRRPTDRRHHLRTGRGPRLHLGAALLAEPVSSVMTAQVHLPPQCERARPRADHDRPPGSSRAGRRRGSAGRDRVHRRRRQGPPRRARGGAQAAGRLHPDPLNPGAGRDREPGLRTGWSRAVRGVRCGRGRASPGSAVRAGGVRDVGSVPALLPPLKPAGGLEIVTHRVLWSCCSSGSSSALPWCAAGRTCARWSPTAGGCSCLAGAAVLIAANWLVFVYGDHSGHVWRRSGTSSTRW